ncbi:MAG: DUF1801 domain-containing protein [Kangiellaceae bacterium]|jgi:hypothetical protein|nr:DUF1801 domain-containing protein [Kangiellaceae bacterium]
MAELKTKPGAENVKAFLEAIEPESRRNNCQEVVELFTKHTGCQPTIWGGSMVGFDQYHYKYASGREGDYFRIGFASRKAALSLYFMDGFSTHQKLMEKLGKYKTGKSCLYIKSLDDIDGNVLEQLTIASLEHMRELYPQ